MNHPAHHSEPNTISTINTHTLSTCVTDPVGRVCVCVSDYNNQPCLHTYSVYWHTSFTLRKYILVKLDKFVLFYSISYTSLYFIMWIIITSETETRVTSPCLWPQCSSTFTSSPPQKIFHLSVCLQLFVSFSFSPHLTLFSLSSSLIVSIRWQLCAGHFRATVRQK